MMNLTQTVILASNSQRRKDLMQAVGVNFVVKTKDTDESFPDELPVDQVAKFIAQKKANAFIDEIHNEIIIAADTVVIKNDQILGKPKSHQEAVSMLSLLSNGKHKVTTGVSILTKNQEYTFDDTTEVHFRALTFDEINYYIDNFSPFDKAGAYGIQEWIGMVAIEKIIGSYFNVVGLPVHKVFAQLKSIASQNK